MKPDAKNPEAGKIQVRLIFGTVPGPLHDGELTTFGLQTTEQDIIPGREQRNKTIFECELAMRISEDAQPVFSGPCANGPASSRFLYLSWKRLNNSPTPWVQRIKIPLSTVTRAQALDALKPNRVLHADVTGRRPHETTTVAWQVLEGPTL
jgi:hypothetical protein